MGCRVLVVAEGEHELGDGPQNSSLVTILQRLLGSLPLTPECRKISSFERRIHGKGNRYTKKLVAILQDAEKEGYEGVLILIDRDTDQDREHAVATAQESDLVSIQRAIGVAIETYDAWYLADHGSLASVLGNRVDLISEPEGQHDPKQLIRELKDQSKFQGSQRQLYFELAKVIDLEFLGKRCPRGFQVFAQRVRGMKLAST